MKIFRTIKPLLVAVYAALILVMGAATFVEQSHGSDFAARHVYQSPWFFSLWAVLAVLGATAIAGRRLWRRFPAFLLHTALLVILLGASLSRLTGQEGTIRLREGDATTTFTDRQGHPRRLPFTLRLDSFRVRYYPATQAPSDFVSYVRHDGTPARVSMNHILSVRGYRLCQSGFDADKRGTTLSVNHDPWGIGITYAGYLLLALSVAGTLVGRLRRYRAAATAALLLALPAAATARDIPTLSADKAERAARLQVVYNDRVAPFDTPARDVLRKVNGRDTYKGLTAVQVAVGWMKRPEVWKQEPLIRVKDAALRRTLSMDGPCISLAALFDGSRYRVADLPPTKAVQELDEKVGLLIMLAQGQLVRPLPAGAKPRPDAHIEAELLYNRLPLTRVLFMLDLALGLFLLLLWLRSRPLPRRLRLPRAAGRSLLALLLLAHLAPWLLRWYVGGHLPLSNGSETMHFMGLCAMLLPLFSRREGSPLPAFGLLTAGFAMLVSHLGEASPQITPLMPVLASPLLSLHVGLVMMAYALLAVTFLSSATALLAPAAAPRAERLGQQALEPAVGLLAIGIFLGAVWANVSWGRYWSWDPKEVWALITLMVYAVPLHAESLPWFRRPRHRHIYLLLAFLTMLMTYFGVNFFLGGMHSYA